MKLDKIVLRNVRADKSKDFISTLEDLPEETIQGDFSIIEAYQHLNGTIILHVMCNKDEFHKTQLNTPKDSRVFGTEENKLWFNYDGQSYKLEKYVEGTCSP